MSNKIPQEDIDLINHLKKLSVTPSVTPYFLPFSEDFISLGKFPCVQVLKKSVIFSFLWYNFITSRESESSANQP